MIEKIRPINLPKINPMETESVPKKQSLKEWAMAGGGVPTQYKGREHVWHGKVKRFAEGGGVHMAGGGMIGKLAKGVIGKAAEAAGMKAPVTAAKDLTTVQDFHTSLGDRVRQRAAEMQDLTESMPFKYDKGQRVFTESSSKKNKPPYTILNRMPFGNSPMRADHPELGPRMGAFMKDPETGKTMRSPYEPGYKVRQEDGEQWSEFTIPESAIKGDVEMAKGGAAFGVFPQMTGKRSKQDPEAAKNMPVDFARGVVSGVLGAPGDIESLVRMIPGLERSRGLGDLVTGNHRETYLPTSEEIEKRIPLRSDTPQSRGASGLGILTGGFYMGPGAPMRLVGGVPTAVYKAGKDFAQAAGQPATKIGPSRLSNVKEAIRQSSGDYAARRLERAADEIPNLEKLYKEDAIRRAFTGDNAKAVATMNPKDFQKYAIEVQKQANVGPQAAAMARKGDISKGTVSTDEYIKHLQRVKGGFDDVPFLELFKDEVGIPSKPRISGHEGRHRNMAMAENQEPAGLVQVFTRGDLREGLPRHHQDEYINALREELDLSRNLVFPESRPMYGRPPVDFPDVYAKGGEVHMAGGGDRVSNKTLSDLIKEDAGVSKTDPRGEMKAYDPTIRERMADALQRGMEGLGGSRYKSRRTAQTFMGGPSSNAPMNLGFADAVPFLGTALGVDEGARDLGHAYDAVKRGDYMDAAVNTVGAAAGLIPGATGTIKGAKAAGRKALAVGRAGERFAERAVPQIMERGGLGAEMLQGMSRGTVSPLDVYHGSPHKYDKFDASKIGTGEGAQVYGHGIYTAEAKDVGREYAKNLANRDVTNQNRLNAHANAQRLAAVTGDPAYAADDIKFVLGNEPDHPQKQLLLETLKHLESGTYKTPLENSGYLYKVDLPDEQIAKMLDWDKPLSQQSAEVQKVFGVTANGKVKLPNGEVADASRLRGESAYRAFAESMSGDSSAASAKLRELGIPGIKYLDANSRGGGQGTRNFVTFPGEEKNLTILERNGQPMVAPTPEGMAKGGAVHMAGGGAAKKVVEGAVKGVKKLLGMADEAPKGVEPIVVRTPEERSVMEKWGQKQEQEAARKKKVEKADKAAKESAGKAPEESGKPPKSTGKRVAVPPDIYRRMAETQGDEAVLKAARAGKHLKPTDGGYIGAPRTVTSGQGLGAMRKGMDTDFADSVEAVRLADPERLGTWYDRAKQGIAESTEPYQLPRTLEQHAVYSAGVSPESELTFALKHLNSRVAGEPQMAYRGAGMRNLDDAVAESRPANLGFKIGEYGEKNDPRLPNTGLFGVNDFRRAQGMTYTDPQGNPWKAGVSDTMHPFMDAETALQVDRANTAGTGGRKDWQGPHIQEVPWVYGKAQDLYSRGLKSRYSGDELEGIKQSLRDANNTARDYFYKNIGSATHEAIPGASTGHVPSMIDAPFEKKVAYGNTGRWDVPAPEYALSDMGTVGAGNRDAIYGALGYRQLPTIEASGAYFPEGAKVAEHQPVKIARPLLDFPTGGGGIVAEPTRHAMEFAERFRALNDAQEAFGFNLPNTMSDVKGKNSLVLDTRGKNPKYLDEPHTGVMPSDQQMGALTQALGDVGYGVAPTSRGATVFPFDSKATAKDAKELMKTKGAELQKIYPSEMEPSLNTSGYGPGVGIYTPDGFKASEPFSGQATSALLKEASYLPPEVAMNLGESESVRRAIKAKIKRDAELPDARADIQETRRFFSEADWPKAVALIRQGYTPAAALAALGYSASSMAKDRR